MAEEEFVQIASRPSAWSFTWWDLFSTSLSALSFTWQALFSTSPDGKSHDENPIENNKKLREMIPYSSQFRLFSL
jgi:hypothetical protein